MTFWSAGLQALPARFRKPRLLIVGCGDVGQRVASILNAYKSIQAQPLRVLALTSSAERIAPFRAQGIVPLLGNLDDKASFKRLAGLATHVLTLCAAAVRRLERPAHIGFDPRFAACAPLPAPSFTARPAASMAI